MKNPTKFSSIHFSAPICVFTVANSVILMPFFGSNILDFLIAVTIGSLVTFIIFKPLKELANINNGVIKGVFYAVIFLLSLAAAVFASREHARFIYANLLLRENMFLIKIIFAICVGFLAGGDKRAIYKFSVLSALFISIIFATMFLVSAKNFDFKNLKMIFNFSDISLKHIGVYSYKLFLPLMLAVLFVSHDMPENLPRFVVPSGTAWGGLLCIAIVFDSILSFGLPLAAKLKYPYIDDISTVTLGSLFTRMDGFAYFAFFVCYILKCAVLIRMCSDILCSMGLKHKKYLGLALSLVLLV